MRWDELFTELEAQFGVEQDADREAARLEELRLRLARTTLRERMKSAASARSGAIRLRLRDGSPLAALPLAFGKDWLSAELAGGAQAILPLAAIASLAFTPAQLEASLQSAAGEAKASVVDRLGLQVMLRDLARRRVALELVCDEGRMLGTIDRVGADHLDIAIHPVDRARRSTEVVEVRTVALASLLYAAVR